MLMLMIFLAVFEYSSFLPQLFLFQCRAAIYLLLAVSYNIMACRMFRLMRLASTALDETSPAMTTIRSELHFQRAVGIEESLNTSIY